MIEKTLYPKTERIRDCSFTITEKIDGSNLGIFKLGGKLLIAQRNNCFFCGEETPTYKGLQGRLHENKDTINLHEGSGVFGEWLGTGQIKYNGAFEKRFYIFAKATITEDLEIENMNYDHDLLIYPFIDQTIPDCIGIVPIVQKKESVTIEYLDTLYDWYIDEVGRPVEGFVVRFGNKIEKYVRNKKGKLTPHLQK